MARFERLASHGSQPSRPAGFSDLSQLAKSVTLTDASADYAMISVQGPQSRRLLQTPGLITADGGQESVSLENEAFPFSTCQEVTVAGVSNVYCLRLTFVGELGWELHVPSAGAVAVYEALRAAGHTLVDETTGEPVPVRDAGYRAIDSLSAEKGYRHWHADLSNRDTPQEAAIGFTVLPRLKKTTAEESPFLGRAALEEQRKRGVQRKIVCLSVGGEKGDKGVPLHLNETIWRDGVCAGYVRSAAYSHTLDTTLVYGYIDCTHDAPKVTNKWLNAGEYEVEDRGVRFPATLHLKSPVDPKNERITG